jgi:hypothetical protein
MGTLPFLEWIVQSGKPFVFVGDGVGQSLLRCLVLNKQRGGLKVAAVRVRGSAEHRKAILEEIASITGGLVFNDDLGVELNQITLREIGTAKRVLIGKDKTVVFSRKRDDVRPQGGEPSDDRNSHDSQPRQAGTPEDQSAAGFAPANGEPIPRFPGGMTWVDLEYDEQLREALVPNSSGTPSSPNQPAGTQIERLQRGPSPVALAALTRWYVERRDAWPAGEKYPSQEADLIAARNRFADRFVSRDVVRAVRAEHAPAAWTNKGRRKHARK